MTEAILREAAEQIARDGAGALSLSAVARRVGIRQPSLYKYFPSRFAVYDELFRRGSVTALETLRQAAAAADPGLPALRAAVTASVRLAVARPVAAQLLVWRPVPGFEPSPEAYAPQLEYVDAVRGMLRDAVELGELHPDAASERGVALLSVLVSGVIGQQLANEPDASPDEGRFVALVDELLDMFSGHFVPRRP